ncbi:MAG: DUF2628 domain-containing protein [Sarcina ventriculi]|nr:DUF2628 domain-containing protein [Sarcina ventriculi]MDD7372775.1 DUF2628 domain-containing protein [Sarcina ventriculi]MDY7062889.1 DUF2628 domain-containing protein [Sarcina ventriculi]
MKVTLLNKNTKQIKRIKVGFSWTTFFFGCFPALFRGDWKWGLIQIVCAICTFGLSSLLFAFIYNKLYINDLLKSGYIAGDESSELILCNKGIIASI